MPKIFYLLLLSALLVACIPTSEPTITPSPEGQPQGLAPTPSITPSPEGQPQGTACPLGIAATSSITPSPEGQPQGTACPLGIAPTPSMTPTGYLREFTHVAALDDYLVGAYYYPWYEASGRHWKGYLGTPLLGQYGSADSLTINRHIDWATGHGIDFFAASWWGRGSFEDKILLEDFPKADLHEQLKIAILYESTGLLTVSDEGIDLSDPINQAQFVSDMRYLAENYFDQPNYLHVGGQPVLFLYLTRNFVGEVTQTFTQARDAVREQTGKELYLIGDEVYWQPPQAERLVLFDAVTAYNMHRAEPDIALGFAHNVATQYSLWHQMASQYSVDFIPNILPGFDDTAVRPEAQHPIIPRNRQLFSTQLQNALPLANSPPHMLMITSWNEWHEYTSIEPAEEFGLDYLEALRGVLEEE